MGAGGSSRCPPNPIDPDDTNPGPGGGSGLGGDTGNGGSSGTGDSGTGDNGGSDQGGIPVTCVSSTFVVVCNRPGEHTDPNDPSCTAPEKGGIFLIVSCSDGSSVEVQLNKGASTAVGCPDDDGPVGIINDNTALADPCKKFKKLAANTDFKNKMQDLQDKAQTDNKETAYKMKSTGFDQYNYSPIEGEPGELGLDPGVEDSDQIDGFIHNHNSDDDDRDLSVFSPSDLYTLYTWLKNDNIKNRGDFVYIVTTAQGTTYGLHIQSKSKFIAFGDAYLDGLQYEKSTNDFTGFIYEGKDAKEFPDGIKNDNSNALNEKHFAKMLHLGGGQGSTGLKLFKATNSFNNWQEIKYNPNNNTVSSSGC